MDRRCVARENRWGWSNLVLLHDRHLRKARTCSASTFLSRTPICLFGLTSHSFRARGAAFSIASVLTPVQERVRIRDDTYLGFWNSALWDEGAGAVISLCWLLLPLPGCPEGTKSSNPSIAMKTMPSSTMGPQAMPSPAR